MSESDCVCVGLCWWPVQGEPGFGPKWDSDFFWAKLQLTGLHVYIFRKFAHVSFFFKLG